MLIILYIYNQYCIIYNQYDKYYRSFVQLINSNSGGEGFILVERNTPLFVVLGMTVHVKTLTKSGSGDILFLHYVDSEGRGAGSFQVKFADQPSYYLGECSGSWVPLSEDLPVEMAKTWSIKRTVTNIYNKIIRVEVSCNEVQLLNITLDETICDSSELDRPWRNNWERQAASVLFPEADTASNFYRLKGKIFIKYNPLNIYNNFQELIKKFITRQHYKLGKTEAKVIICC